MFVRGNSIYTVVDGPSWTDAEDNAHKLGGNLVAINDEAEANYLTNEFSNYSKYAEQPHGDSDETFSHWIGLTDSQK